MAEQARVFTYGKLRLCLREQFQMPMIPLPRFSVLLLLASLNLAPVAEPMVADKADWRSAAPDMETVRSYATAFADGMVDGGVAPTLKHLPGQTRTLEFRPDPGAWLNAPREDKIVLDDPEGAEDRLTVRQAAEAFWDFRFPYLVTLSNHTYPGVVPGPAVQEDVSRGWLDGMGFDEVVVTDSLEGVGITPELALGAFSRRTLRRSAGRSPG